ncbi:zinc finger BED domain-containing protein RICESLEEPER 2-like [Castanea sativa]|uniref:zinc finger BED domain-containing protein RICESLEEPER 2-like n=1 Tax=Castanea sativa TaxID=21020 RepID=UPI003F652F44
MALLISVFLMNETTEIPEGQDLEAGQGTTNVQKDKGKPPLPPNSDSDWKIHKRILSFCLVENHKGETLGKAVEMCLLDWGIDKILTITVDNDASNSWMISFIQKKTKHRKATILGHKYLHVRCSAHILNLIVREGLVEMDETIVKVRKSVRYVRSSPQRQNTFKLCAEKEKVEFKGQLCLDVPTRWNYTYIMLEKVEV